MIPVLAHGIGPGGLPLSRWLLAYLLAFTVVLVFLGLRVSAATRPVRPAAPRPPRPWNIVLRALGMVLFVTVFAVAAFAENTNGFFSTVLLTMVFWLGGVALSVVIGHWYWAVNPFDSLAALLFRRENDRRPPALPWTAAVLLFGFIWFWLIYAFRVPTNTEVAQFLAAYTVLVVAGAAYWGRAWVAHGEGFGAVFGLLARSVRAAPAPAPPGTAALAAVLLGGIAYDGMSQTSWWLDVLGTRDDNAWRLVSTVGLLWTTAIVGAGYLVAIWLVQRIADSDEPRAKVADRYAAALIPLGAACWLMHELPTFLVSIQDGIALASDPLGRGWDLFGTIDWAVNCQVLTPTQQAWIQIALLVAGAAAACLIIHRISFAHYPPQVALRVIYPLGGALMIATVAASGLLLGT